MEFLHPAMWHDHDIDFARWLQPAAFWALIGPDLTNSSTCGLGKESKKKENKKKKTVANWLFAQTTHVAVPKSKFACRVASGV